jgi:hypothetical protein
LTGGFKVGTSPYIETVDTDMSQEAHENASIIRVYDSMSAFKTLLHHIYNLTYKECIAAGDNAMTFAVKVYAVADKYDVKGLQHQAASKLKNVLDPNKNIKDFVAAIKEVDESTNPADPTLWNIAISAIKANITMLRKHNEFLDLVFERKALNVKLLSELNGSPSPPLASFTSLTRTTLAATTRPALDPLAVHGVRPGNDKIVGAGGK